MHQQYRLDEVWLASLAWEQTGLLKLSCQSVIRRLNVLSYASVEVFVEIFGCRHV